MCHKAILNCPKYNFMFLYHCLWHVKGVAAKYFSVIHAPAKRIFGVKGNLVIREKKGKPLRLLYWQICLDMKLPELFCIHG